MRSPHSHIGDAGSLRYGVGAMVWSVDAGQFTVTYRVKRSVAFATAAGVAFAVFDGSPRNATSFLTGPGASTMTAWSFAATSLAEFDGALYSSHHFANCAGLTVGVPLEHPTANRTSDTNRIFRIE
jgi:hypothetical protein